MNKLLVFTVFFTLGWAPVNGQTSEWKWLNPIVQGNTLNAVYFIDSQLGYAVGESNTILKTVDGGVNWNIQYNSTLQNISYIGLLKSIYFTDSNTGYIGGRNGIWTTVDGGENWTFMPEIQGINSIIFPDHNTGYAVGGEGVILKTINGGTTWEQQKTGTTNSLNSVHFVDVNKGYAVGDNDTILKTIDGGTTWTKLFINTTSALYSVYFTSADTGYVLEEGTLLKTCNGGLNWIAKKTGNSYYSICFLNAKVGYAVGDYNSIIMTLDGGQQWLPLGSFRYPSLNSYDCFNSVYVTKNNTVYAAGTNGIIVKSMNSPCLWKLQTNCINEYPLFSTYFTDSNVGYSVGCCGAILKTIDGGANWSLQNKGYKDFRSIFFVNSDTGYIVGIQGIILNTSDKGTNWEAQTSNTTKNLNSVFFVDKNSGFAVGDEGTILNTKNGGKNWTNQVSNTTANLNSAFFINAGSGYAVGSGGTILKTIDGGTTWVNQLHSTNTLKSVFFTDANTGYAAGENYFKTIDGGKNWVEHYLYHWVSEVIQSIFFLNPDTGYMVGDFGAIIKTTNGGDTWTVDRITDESINSIYFIDNKGYAVGNSGLILTNATVPYLKVPVDSLIIVNSSASFSIFSNTSWHASCDQPWIKLDTISGSKNATINLTALPNNTFSPQIATITISGTNVISKTITVTQAAGSPILTVSTNEINITATANDSATFEIKSNLSWYVSCDQSWIKFYTTSGSNDATVSLTALANNSTVPRIATITISGTNVISKIITVNQETLSTDVKSGIKSDILIYPIPVINHLLISFIKPISLQSVFIYSVYGLVYSARNIENAFEIDMSKYSSGVYIVKIVTIDNTVIFKKIVKQ